MQTRTVSKKLLLFVKKLLSPATRSVTSLLLMYSILLFSYTLFSYSQTDPNLVLINWQQYWLFQQWMWETLFKNPTATSWLYGVLIAGLFSVYTLLVRALERSSLEYELGWKKYLIIWGLLVAPLLFSYNALSHDVFNYIFNAKMVVVYTANPHVQVALDFATDPWIRFMHNTHTPAPYWYGWTGLSLIPYVLGMGKFILTWLAFRIWSILSVLMLYFALQYAAKVFTGSQLQAYQLALVFCNPLFLIEVISNMHNDLWMVVPALVAVALVTDLKPGVVGQAKKMVLALILLLLSISIKLATAALIPLVVLVILEKNFLFTLVESLTGKLPFLKMIPGKLLQSLESYLYQYIPVVAAVLLFMPLLTPRSQQFHPWYWTWVLVWVPFIKNSFWKNVVLLFSLTSMLRYIPWLWAGNFEGSVLLYQQIVTWLPVLLYVCWKCFPRAIARS